MSGINRNVHRTRNKKLIILCLHNLRKKWFCPDRCPEFSFFLFVYIYSSMFFVSYSILLSSNFGSFFHSLFIVLSKNTQHFDSSFRGQTEFVMFLICSWLMHILDEKWFQIQI